MRDAKNKWLSWQLEFSNTPVYKHGFSDGVKDPDCKKLKNPYPANSKEREAYWVGHADGRNSVVY